MPRLRCFVRRDGREEIAARLRPTVLAAFVCTGAAISLTATSVSVGQLRPESLTGAGWLWLACLAAVSTLAAISLFFAGLGRVGSTTASILATVEPLVTVVLVFLVFGEALGTVQLAGGTLILAAVVLLHARQRRSSDADARPSPSRRPMIHDVGTRRTTA